MVSLRVDARSQPLLDHWIQSSVIKRISELLKKTSLYWNVYKARTQSTMYTSGTIKERQMWKSWRIFATIRQVYSRSPESEELGVVAPASLVLRMSPTVNYLSSIKAVWEHQPTSHHLSYHHSNSSWQVPQVARCLHPWKVKVLRVHQQWEAQISAATLQTCPICNQLWPNRMSFHKHSRHIRRVHHALVLVL